MKSLKVTFLRNTTTILIMTLLIMTIHVTLNTIQVILFIMSLLIIDFTYNVITYN
jgi:hypothetical protein